ncbi:MAG: hypothetical protein B6U97_02690, partial [Candidatus Altiarchaeales archaeon ex4484_96]
MKYLKLSFLVIFLLASSTQAKASNISEADALIQDLLSSAVPLEPNSETVDLAFYAYEVDGVESKILSWSEPGDVIVNLKVPANTVVSDTALFLSFTRDFGQSTLSIESSCYEKCWGCGEKHCSDADTKTYEAGDGIYYYNVSSSCAGSGSLEINGVNACDRDLGFISDNLNFESSCSGWSPCHGCPYFGGAECNIEGSSIIEYRRLPATNLTLDVLGDGVIDWEIEGEFIDSTLISDFTDELNLHLANCTPNQQGYCIIPLVLHSDSAGQVNLSGINIGFEEKPVEGVGYLTLHAHKKVSCGTVSCDDLIVDSASFNPTESDSEYLFMIQTTTSGRVEHTSSFANWRSSRRIYEITCYKKDGSIQEWEKNFGCGNGNIEIIQYFKCTRLGFAATAKAVSSPHDSTTSWLDAEINISYSTSKDYLSFGCYSNSSCDDNNSNTWDECIDNVCMHKSAGSWFESDASLTAGEKAKVTAIVHNSASKKASFIASLLVDGVPQCFRLVEVEGGESVDVVFNFTPPGGLHNISISIDSSAALGDLFVGNNIISREVEVEGTQEDVSIISTPTASDVLAYEGGYWNLRVGCSLDRECWDGISSTTDECVDGFCVHLCTEGDCFPEFVDPVSDYSINPTNLFSGDEVPVEVTVYNNGELDAINFLVSLEEDGEIVDYEIVSLEEGKSKVVEFSWTASPGEHTLSAYIDPLPEPDGVIAESREDNNVLSTSFIVKDSPEKTALTDLLAYWPMDEGLGDTVKDYSGGGFHSIVSGGSWVNGVSGSGLFFDGLGSHVEVSDSGLLAGLSEFSVCGWIRQDGLNAAGYDGSLFGEKKQIQLRHGYGDGFFFRVFDDAGNSSHVAVSSGYPTGRWYFVCGVYSPDYLRLYVDGVLAGEELDVVPDVVASTGNPLYVGGRGGDAGSYDLNGSVDDVRVYSRALVSREIKALFNLYRGGPLVAAYYLDEDAGSVANDSSGNMNHGLIHGASWVDGFSGSALSFDGINDYVDLGDFWGVEDIEKLSLGAWVKPSGNATQNAMRIISKKADIELVYRSIQGDFMCRLHNESTGYSDWVISSSGFGDNRWHQVYCVYNSSHVMLYVDGILQDDVESFTGRLIDGASILALGRRGSQDDYYFKGLIDEVLIHDEALSWQAIKQQYEDYSTLISYYFSEGSGNKTLDSSFNNYTGFLHGANWTEGISGYALSFDGVDDKLNSSLVDGVTGDKLSVSSWVYVDDVSTQNYQQIIDKGSNLAFWVGNSGDVCVRLSAERNASGSQDCFSAGLEFGRWHHLAFSYDANADERLKLYVDGRFIGSSNNYYGLIGSNTAKLIVGNTLSGSRPFNGLIDELAVYRLVLNDSVVHDIYNAYRGGPLVAAYYLDEGSGLVANDSSGNENHGVIGAASWVKGISETALYFDGSDNIRVSDHASLDGFDELTLEAWVKTSASEGVVLEKEDAFSLNVVGGRLCFSYGFGCFLSNSSIDDGSWHHVVVVHNESSDKLIVDGLLDSQDASIGSIPDSRYDLFLGEDFIGYLDEILIYDVALSAESVRQQYEDYSRLLVYHFSEGVGNETYDSSFNNYTGLLHGANWTDGVSGYALSFDGVDDYVDSGLVDGVAGDKLSVSSWVYVDGVSAQGYQRIVDKHGNLAFWVGNDGSVCVRLSAERNVSTSADCFNTHLEFGRWHHLAFTYDANADERLRLYVNGRFFGYVNNYFGSITSSTSALIVGNTLTGTRPFNGLID